MESKVHQSEQISRRNGGFTLLELLIAVVVLAVLIGSAAPSFEHMVKSSQLKRLATEIEWLMAQAKSEAVMRSELITVDIQEVAINSAIDTKPNWRIQAKTSMSDEVIAEVKGDQFTKVAVYKTFPVTNILFDSMTGRPNHNGSFVLSAGEKDRVRVKASNMTGRLYVCSESGGYGYGTCPES